MVKRDQKNKAPKNKTEEKVMIVYSGYMPEVSVPIGGVHVTFTKGEAVGVEPEHVDTVLKIKDFDREA